LLARELEDPRVTLVVNEGRRLGGALNTGMRHAATDFVAILFADDMWATHAAAVLNHAIRQNPGVDFFHSSRIIIDERDKTYQQYSLQQRFVSARRLPPGLTG